MGEQKPFPIPVNYFSIVLGLSALGEAWRFGSEKLGLPSIIGDVLLIASSIIWLIFTLAYVYKWTSYRSQAKDELHNIIQCCFISLLPITTILTGLAIKPDFLFLAQVLVGVGIISQLAFAAYRAAGLWRGIHKAEATTPIMYLPTVAANFVSATALSSFGLTDWAILFFGAGMFSWLSLEAAILQRLRSLGPVAPPLRPIIGIQLAPAFVGCSTYLSLNGGEVDLFAKLMIGYGLLQLLFLIRLLPWIAENGFSPSFWAFSFGLASMASVGLHLEVTSVNHGLGMIGIPMFWFSSICIGILIILTLTLLFRGKFFVKS
ncbi:MAG: dicarboxylate transporter/tellurite-resistance protein TehA [Pasteurellaceae bacterium]|nr:dicarboxylate transporter/tellurite-resistance protein TehA [Pasteurellaceae bacterium]